MKINGIPALDYQTQGDDLVLVLTGTDMEEVTGMDTSLLRVETDDGSLVEALAGYQLVRVTYETAEGTFTAVLVRVASDDTATALKALNEAVNGLGEALRESRQEVAELRQENEEMAGQLEELTGAIERGLTQ